MFPVLLEFFSLLNKYPWTNRSYLHVEHSILCMNLQKKTHLVVCDLWQIRKRIVEYCQQVEEQNSNRHHSNVILSWFIRQGSCSE